LGRFDLEQVLCHEEERTVGRDNTVTSLHNTVFGELSVRKLQPWPADERVQQMRLTSQTLQLCCNFHPQLG